MARRKDSSFFSLVKLYNSVFQFTDCVPGSVAAYEKNSFYKHSTYSYNFIHHSVFYTSMKYPNRLIIVCVQIVTVIKTLSITSCEKIFSHQSNFIIFCKNCQIVLKRQDQLVLQNRYSLKNTEKQLFYFRVLGKFDILGKLFSFTPLICDSKGQL